MDDKQKLSEEEIDSKIKSIKGIWGIEGMGMTEEEEKIHRDYLSGKITKEQHTAYFIKKIKP